MAEINFKFKGSVTKMQYNINDKIADICKRFALKIEEDINDLYFLYNGDQINLLDEKLNMGELTRSIKSIDEQSQTITILVNKNTATIIAENHSLKSKDIICPKCIGNSRIKIEDYKITLFECEKKHTSKDICFKDFEKTQYIDESKIKCHKCRNNKEGIFNNKFYRCNSCKLNLSIMQKFP